MRVCLACVLSTKCAEATMLKPVVTRRGHGGWGCRVFRSILLLLVLLLLSSVACENGQETNVTADDARTSEAAESLEDSTTPLIPQQDARHFLRSFTRDLKRGSRSTNNDIEFNQPIEDWDVEEWIALAVLIFVAAIALCCLCNIVQCILGCLCSCMGCGGGRQPRRRYFNRGYYYDASAPLQDNNPPPFNPAYSSNARAIPAYYDAPPGARSDCSLLDCIAAFCCLQCCSQNRFSTRDICCGICCFEFCCRGGRDIFGSGNNSTGYGSFA